jgi:hypothetical protein
VKPSERSLLVCSLARASFFALAAFLIIYFTSALACLISSFCRSDFKDCDEAVEVSEDDSEEETSK